MIKKIKGFLKKYNIDDVDKIFWFSMVFVLLAMICVMGGCVSSIYKVRKENINDKVEVTHVLAVTEMGDTLKIPISEIKPKVIYNVVGYNYMRHNPYYSPYNNRYYYDYYNYNRNYNNNQGIQGSGSSIQYNNISPTTQISVPSSGGSYSGTSGFSGNPVASNPVTSNGGAKTKN
jgi:hypothetical protein